MARRRIDPKRLRRVNRIVREVLDAIEQDRFLVRLPGERTMARLVNGSVREVRQAMKVLAEEGWVKVAAWGHEVVRRPDPVRRLKTAVLVQHQAPTVFAGWVALGAERRCRHWATAFQNHCVNRDEFDQAVGQLAAEMPGRDVGWMLLFPPSPERLRAWQAEGRRVVLIDQDSPQAPVPLVLLNHVEALGRAEQFLASRGHRRVGLIFQRQFTIDRHLRSQGRFLEFGWDLLYHTPEEYGINAMADWLRRWRSDKPSERPTAVLLYNLEVAEVFCRICRVLRIKAPEELSVMGFGSQPGGSPDFRFTYMASGKATDLGAAAVDLLTRPRDLERNPVVMVPTGGLVNPDATVARARR